MMASTALSLPGRHARFETHRCAHCGSVYTPTPSETPALVERVAYERIAIKLVGAHAMTLAFFRVIFDRNEPQPTSAKVVATRVGVHQMTLSSRFFRAGLPSPKQYIVGAQMLLVVDRYARGMRGTKLSVEVGASSPQSLTRTVRLHAGMTLTQLCSHMDRAQLLDRYESMLVDPYLGALRALPWGRSFSLYRDFE